MLEAGIRGEQSVAVTSENTAKTMGSGTLDVFATPALVALAEKTCWMSVAAALDEEIPWWRRLNAPRQAVLLDMAFNMGAEGLMSFRRTLRAVREQRWKDARDGMLASKWAGQVGRRASELAEQMMTGEWQG